MLVVVLDAAHAIAGDGDDDDGTGTDVEAPRLDVVNKTLLAVGDDDVKTSSLCGKVVGGPPAALAALLLLLELWLLVVVDVIIEVEVEVVVLNVLKLSTKGSCAGPADVDEDDGDTTELAVLGVDVMVAAFKWLVGPHA